MPVFFDDAWSELIKGGQTAKAEMSQEVQSASIIGVVDPEVLPPLSSLEEILGKTTTNGRGGLERKLPISHPEFNWLFASKVAIQGIGFKEKADSEPCLEAEGPKNYAKYKKYMYQIEFLSRPYVLFKDSSIPVRRNFIYYKDNPNGDGTHVSVNVADLVEEWWRYTDYEETPTSEYLTAEQGQYFFYRSDNAPPSGKPLPGKIKVLAQTKSIKFRWYQVPYSYIESQDSYITRAQGHVNQFDFMGWPAGTLLYVNFSYKRYTPPNPGTFGWGPPGVISNEKLVDMEFNFKYFNPKTLAGGELPTITNLTHIPAGHNLLPYLAGGTLKNYYYVRSGVIGRFEPIYPSFPFEMMFQDPDVV